MSDSAVRISAEWERRIEAFDAACAVGAVDWTRYLPDELDSMYEAVLSELVRVDLEYAWKRGERRRIEWYRTRFQRLFDNPEALRGVAYEEYRLRRQAGEEPTPAEYLARIGMPIGFWPRPRAAVSGAAG